MKRVLFTATLVRGHIAKFHIPYLKWFKEHGWETWVAARNDYPDGVCEIPYCDHYVDVPFSRSPYNPTSHRAALKVLRATINSTHFDLIHTHTPVGSVLTRWAARDARKRGTKVFYTAHGFHFFDGAPLKNWVMWYPVEKFMSRYADVLITINQEDYKRAQQFAHCTVEYMPGVGVDIEELRSRANPSANLQEFGIPDDAFAVLSVGDLIPRKNFSSCVEALSLLDDNYHLIICGVGELQKQLSELAQSCSVAERVHCIGFRNDVPAIMAASDVFVLPSRQEGLSVAVLEAMLLGLPVVVSNTRGLSPDLVQDGVNGLVLHDASSKGVAAAIRSIAGKKQDMQDMVNAARETVKTFALESVLPQYLRLVATIEQQEENQE